MEQTSDLFSFKTTNPKRLRLHDSFLRGMGKGPSEMIKISRMTTPVHNLLKSEEAIGMVHSVFERSLNVILRERLVHIQWERELKSPFSLQLNGASIGGFQKTLKEGDPVFKEDRWLRVGDAAVIEYAPEELELYHPRIRFAQEISESRLYQISAVLGQEVQSLLRITSPLCYMSQVEAIVMAQTHKLLENLKTPHTHLHLINEFTGKLIGLGPGLTPFGDDLLVAILCALVSFRSNSKAIQDFFKHFRYAILIHLNKTCLISREFLRYAVNGFFSEKLNHLMNHLLFRPFDEEKIREVIRWGFDFGATSWIGTLMGVDDGLRMVSALNHDGRKKWMKKDGSDM
jgi:hypothetical protein